MTSLSYNVTVSYMTRLTPHGLSLLACAGFFWRKMRKIKIVGDIDEESYGLFSDQMDELESDNSDTIHVELTSGGGEAITALAFIDRMRLSPCTIEVTVLGSAQSAASIILACGDLRRMAKNAWAMIHEDSVHKFSGTVQEVEAYAKRLRQLEDQWCEIFSKHCGGSIHSWRRLHSRERYLDANQCLELGIIDEII